MCLGTIRIRQYPSNTNCLTLNPLMWKIWRAPNNASRWQMGFNSAFKGLIYIFRLVTCFPH